MSLKHLESFIDVFRGSCWPHSAFVLELKSHKLEFGFALGIIIEPVIEAAGVGPPLVVDVSRIFNAYLLDLFKQDGLGGHQRDIVLF